ncbi:hypothetical protein GCM10009837_43710 [Streptomyces durmitorensis]|uniref:PH domain-containing protein n=1 Tax=Streptomyces durmitorensis TaxID=319947 RepID=A0ABY4Q640_9ACTN|nr:hypothetical protein [Streptomyces durmitorensis]UQT60621.1 hypothetical protein M4V62_39220 [Streptomyces durmitorensis]
MRKNADVDAAGADGEALWRAADRDAHLRSRILRASVTVVVGLGFGGLLFAAGEQGAAAVITGCVLLVGLPVAVHWLRDSRAVVEVDAVGGDRSVLRLRRAVGGIVDIPAGSVSRVHLVTTPFQEPDTPGDGTAVLHLRTRQGRRYRCRFAGMDRRQRARFEEAWSRACPTASFTTGVRTWPLPSGDYD